MGPKRGTVEEVAAGADPFHAIGAAADCRKIGSEAAAKAKSLRAA